MPARRPTVTVSNSAADRAGRQLRVWWEGDDETYPVTTVIGDAWDVMNAYRAMHEYPLVLVTNGLRDLVVRHAGGGTVSQRYKRVPRMLDKLGRFPQMRLSQMEDIGGCRAIVADTAAVRRVRARIRNNWDVIREYDYDVEPKPTGYRARHLVVRRTGRLIEIQLRTPRQHEWAEAVEQADTRGAIGIKDGAGPPPLREFFQVSSRILAMQEMGQWVLNEETIAIRERFDTLIPLVGVYFPAEPE